MLLKYLKYISVIFFLFTLLWIALVVVVTNPLFSKDEVSWVTVDARVDVLESHVKYFSEMKPRYFLDTDALDEAALYIFEEFEKSWCELSYQDYTVDYFEYKNVVCSFNIDQKATIIVWAHYDVDWELPWADDNASGVAWILEIAKIVWSKKSSLDQNYRYDIVAFTLEELPYFRTDMMWSNQYIQAVLSEWRTIEYLINLEMIWYYSGEMGSQRYPVWWIEWIYGDVWDFIAVVGRVSDFWLTRSVKRDLSKYLNTKSINAPRILPWIDFSDHLSFWNAWIPAVMITDTSFYRNKNYHTLWDTYDTLDYVAMSKVVEWVSEFLLHN